MVANEREWNAAVTLKRQSNRNRLAYLFAKRAISRGEFTLASGKKSNHYLDAKSVLFNAEASSLLGELIADTLTDIPFDAIGGLEMGSVAPTVAALGALHARDRRVEGFFVRRRAKHHGTAREIEGQLLPHSRVVIVDDVLTTGAAALRAAQAVERVGHRVVAVVCVCDRLQGAAEALRAYPYYPLFTVRDFGIEPDVSDKMHLADFVGNLLAQPPVPK